MYPLLFGVFGLGALGCLVGFRFEGLRVWGFRVLRFDQGVDPGNFASRDFLIHLRNDCGSIAENRRYLRSLAFSVVRWPGNFASQDLIFCGLFGLGALGFLGF